MKDRIRITGLEVDTVIGVHRWERRVRQRLRLDLDLPTDIRTASASAELADALDYSAVADFVRETCAAARCLLIETLAEDLAAALMERFALPAVRLTLHKPGAVPGATDLALEIERHR